MIRKDHIKSNINIIFMNNIVSRIAWFAKSCTLSDRMWRCFDEWRNLICPFLSMNCDHLLMNDMTRVHSMLLWTQIVYNVNAVSCQTYVRWRMPSNDN